MRHNNTNQSQGQRNRGRNRNNGGRRGSGGGGGNRNSFDSNGPNVRIRGSASQIYEKYATMARDATTSGDRVLAETLFQHADHYYRIANPDQDGQPAARRFQQTESSPDAQQTEGDDGAEQAVEGAAEDVVVIDTTQKDSEEPDSGGEPATTQTSETEEETPEAAPPKRGRGRPRAKTKAVREPQTPAELAEAVAEQ